MVAFCLAKNRVPRRVRKDAKLVAELQDRLAAAGSDLDWPEDIAKTVR